MQTKAAVTYVYMPIRTAGVKGVDDTKAVEMWARESSAVQRLEV